MGAKLAAALNSAIESKATDETSASDIKGQMASAAGIEQDTVNQILNGSISCPPVERLEGFAEVLDVSLETLQSAAESDGCSYSDDGERAYVTVDSRYFDSIRRTARESIRNSLRRMIPQ